MTEDALQGIKVPHAQNAHDVLHGARSCSPAQILSAGNPALRICQPRRIASHDMAWRARVRSMTFSYVIIIYDLAILTLSNVTLVRHSVLQHCAGQGVGRSAVRIRSLNVYVCELAYRLASI